MKNIKTTDNGSVDSKKIMVKENHTTQNGVAKKSHQVADFSEESRALTLKAYDVSREISAWLGNETHERVSIGQYCVAAHYIRETAIKTARPYPFDWIGVTPEIVLHLFQDEFKIFLDKNMMYSSQKNAKGEDQAGNRFYANNIYFHFDPLKSERAYRYLKASVHRFLKLFNSQQPAVFISTVIQEWDKHKNIKDCYIHQYKPVEDCTIEDYKPIIDYATSVNPNIKFFFLEQYTEGQIEMKTIYKDDYAYWLKFTSAGKNYGTEYVDNFDDTLCKILFKGLVV